MSFNLYIDLGLNKANKEHKSFWIIKPGEHTNRGKGIKLCDSVKQITQYIKSANPGCKKQLGAHNDSTKVKTFVIQKYIANPLLISGRKFDIRCFGLFTCINGTKKGYFYQGGYVRTSSHEFSLDDVEDKMVHLTNDAVQKRSKDYGKYET